jgi:hypothetical protein
MRRSFLGRICTLLCVGVGVLVWGGLATPKAGRAQGQQIQKFDAAELERISQQNALKAQGLKGDNVEVTGRFHFLKNATPTQFGIVFEDQFGLPYKHVVFIFERKAVRPGSRVIEDLKPGDRIRLTGRVADVGGAGLATLLIQTLKVTRLGNQRNPQGDAVEAAKRTLEQSALFSNGNWYVQFELRDLSRTALRDNEYARIVQPGEWIAPIPSGKIEFSLRKPEVIEKPTKPGAQWNGLVIMRIQQYRVYDPANGWQTRPLSSQWLTWNAEDRDGQMSVVWAPPERAVGLNGVRSFVASIFYLPTANVRCAKTAPEDL